MNHRRLPAPKYNIRRTLDLQMAPPSWFIVRRIQTRVGESAHLKIRDPVSSSRIFEFHCFSIIVLNIVSVRGPSCAKPHASRFSQFGVLVDKRAKLEEHTAREDWVGVNIDLNHRVLCAVLSCRTVDDDVEQYDQTHAGEEHNSIP